jgi:peptidoglycan/LPS O-acetylase OafA/YrhL
MRKPMYFPQLDGLRALAISLVILFHWFPEDGLPQAMALGSLGVTLFFVLSGFLITLILLKTRRSVSETGFLGSYAGFMVKRMLRIFPLYYFVLFFVWAAQFLSFLPDIYTRFCDNPSYYLMYGSNFLIDRYGDWADMLSIYWTLAVEEQFYLIWPVVILLVPRQHLRMVIISCIACGVLSRGILLLAGSTDGVLMPTCLDSFGFGALWALTLFEKTNQKQFLDWIRKSVWAGLGVYLFFCFYYTDSVPRTLLLRTAMSVMCLYFVVMASYESGFTSFFGRVLGSQPVRFAGKISYGIYMYHMLVPQFFVPATVRLAGRLLGNEIVLSETSYRLVSLLLLGVVSVLSWYLIELPFRYLRQGVRLSWNGQVKRMA